MSSAQIYDSKLGEISSGRTFPINDYALERIIYRAPHAALAAIPFPDGLAPRGTAYDRPADQPLPRADVVVVTWTVAEGQALADALTPGVPSTTWKPYAHRWDDYVPQLTTRSPARRAGCLGYVARTKIGQVDVLLIKSELHLATDAISAPIVTLWRQIIDEARPSMIISTGTAGGIGAETQLGDVFVVTNAKFNCTKDFQSMPWAQRLFTGAAIHAESYAPMFGAMTAPERRTPVSGRHATAGADFRSHGGRRGNGRLFRVCQYHRRFRNRPQLPGRPNRGNG